MKKTIYILTMGLFVGFAISSCTKKFEPIFEENASERIEVAIQNYNRVLKSNQEIWVFQYFPEETQRYGGYNFFLKFSDPNIVEVKTELDGTGKDFKTSKYDIIQNGGSVLTFNTYNSFMHFFANPSVDEYQGKQGDFEFLIMSANDEEMKLRGMKTGNKMRLFKTSKSPEEYVADIHKVSAVMSGATIRAKFGEVMVQSSLQPGRQLVFNYTDKEGNEVSKKVAYVYTDRGIRLYEPVEINKIEVEEFVLEDGQLKSLDGKALIEFAYSPIDFSTLAWGIDVSADKVSAEVKQIWQQAHDADFQKWGEELYPYFNLGFTHSKTIGVSMYSKAGNKPDPYRATYLLSFSGSFESENYIVIEPVGEGFNWKWYRHLSPVVDMLLNNSPYVVEKTNDVQVKLTSVQNPSIWFVVNKNN